MPTTSSKTYAITGANRGLGLEFARQLSAPGTANTIVAAVRSLSGELDDLKALASKNTSSKIHILECDTGSLPSISAFGSAVSKLLDGKQLDVLLNNAGINAVPNQTSLDLGEEDVLTHIQINVLGPAKTTEALSPLLGNGSVVVNMTSGLGSCARSKKTPKCAAYSISKAAVNMLTVHNASDLRGMGVRAICMDPGWVKTRMGGEGAVLEPEVSIGGMLRTIERVEEGDSGKFYTYTGEEVPW